MAKPGVTNQPGAGVLWARALYMGPGSPSTTLGAGSTNALTRATTDVAGFRNAAVADYQRNIVAMTRVSAAVRNAQIAGARVMRSGVNASSRQPTLSLALSGYGLALSGRVEYERTARTRAATEMGA